MLHVTVELHECATHTCTWNQRVAHAERRAGGRAARALARVLRGGRQVAQLPLQLVQQRRVHVEQCLSLSQVQLQ